MRIQEAYTEWSATYDGDRNLTRDLDELVTRATLGDLRCKSVLEIGCGTGKNTRLLAQIGERVMALDFSAGMIEKARAKLPLGHVTFEAADITRPWPAADQSIDLVACNLVLEHIANLSFVFSEASRVLVETGQFFVSELHPFRQYQGTQANYLRDQQRTEIQAFVHHISDFLAAAAANNLRLARMKEWWHEEDQNKPPRLVSFLFEKASNSSLG